MAMTIFSIINNSETPDGVLNQLKAVITPDALNVAVTAEGVIAARHAIRDGVRAARDLPASSEQAGLKAAPLLSRLRGVVYNYGVSSEDTTSPSVFYDALTAAASQIEDKLLRLSITDPELSQYSAYDYL